MLRMPMGVLCSIEVVLVPVTLAGLSSTAEQATTEANSEIQDRWYMLARADTSMIFSFSPTSPLYGFCAFAIL